MLHMSLQANGMAGLFSPNYNKMDVDWSDKARQQEQEKVIEKDIHPTEGPLLMGEVTNVVTETPSRLLPPVRAPPAESLP